MGRYRRLNMLEREEISRLLSQGLGIRAIGRYLGRSGSTISREVHRASESCWRYRAIRAEQQARRNATARRKDKRKLFINRQLAEAVLSKLRLFWSPEQIAKWLKREYATTDMYVSGESIYTYLYVLPRGELKREMAEHKLFTKQTKMKVYFAHPKSPWERGTNENTNGLIRQFFPEGTDFRKVSRKEIKRAQHLLNGRPRKTLNFKTPYEAMQELLQ